MPALEPWVDCPLFELKLYYMCLGEYVRETHAAQPGSRSKKKRR